jgi:hypothetical protein
MCCKLRGYRQSVRPARVFALAGAGIDAENWQRAAAIRRQGKKVARAWLADVDGQGVDAVPEGMEPFEERRQAALKLVKRLDDRASWIALDAFVTGG